MKWSESYNCHKAEVAKGALTLHADWRSTRGGPEDENGFFVNVNGRALRKPFRDLEEAKRAARTLAFRIAAEATAELS